MIMLLASSREWQAQSHIQEEVGKSRKFRITYIIGEWHTLREEMGARQ